MYCDLPSAVGAVSAEVLVVKEVYGALKASVFVEGLLGLFVCGCESNGSRSITISSSSRCGVCLAAFRQRRKV